MHHLLQLGAGDIHLAPRKAHHLFQALADPGHVLDQVDFPGTVLGAADGALVAAFDGVERRLGALQVADVDDGAGDARHLARAVARHRGLLAYPAFAAAVEQHPVFAAIGGLLGSGVDGRAAHVGDIVRMHARDQLLQIVEPGRGRNAEQRMKILGADPGVAAKIKIEGRQAGGGLRNVERLGGVAQPLLELLALRDIDDRADGADGPAVGILHHLGAAGQPAHLTIQEQGAVFGLVLGARVDGGAQGQHHAFHVLGVNGRHPLLAA